MEATERSEVDVADDRATDVVVVGGGLAGLSAAATAARAGRSVALFEARHPGGRAAVTTVDPGVVFNAGPRAFYTGGPGEAALRHLGIEAHGGSPDTANSYCVRDGVLHPVPGDPLTLLRTRLLGLRSKVKVGSVLARLAKLDTASLASVSVSQWMADQGFDDDAVELLRMVLRTATYSNEVDDFSAGAAMGQVQLALGPGVRYLDGGFAQLVDALRDAATSAGATVIDHDAVRSVDPHPSEPSAWVVRTSSRSVVARSVVVATGGPDAVERLLPVALDRSGLTEPVTAACLELGVRRPPQHPLLLGVGVPLYLSRHTPAAASLAPDGITVVHVVRYGARTSDEDRRDLWAHAARVGLTSDDVVAERFLHKMVVCGGLPRPSTGGLAGRPAVTVPGVDGLYIAGDWVGREGLLADAALASGRRAAELAVGRAAEPAATRAARAHATRGTPQGAR